ncbi:MAG: winged helix-turn-helix domain-containing protein [Nitrosarchaeum sp.]|nr:winged helix-turn-helix domain-containing protein [Nitrosarchaeum sp.]
MDDASEILDTISDEQSREIIKLLSNFEYNIQQISDSLNIPLSTAYRKVKKLDELKLIKKTKVIRTLEGLNESYYKNWIYEIVITYRDGNLSYTLEHAKIEEKIIRLWQKFSE